MVLYMKDMGGCQNYGPFLDPHYNTAPNMYGTPKGTIILTTTHMTLRLARFNHRNRPAQSGSSLQPLNPKLLVALEPELYHISLVV